MSRHGQSFRALSEETGDPSPNPEEALELKQTIEEALAALSSRDRAIVCLWAEGYSQEEIGQRFGMTQQGISLVIRKLRLYKPRSLSIR